jgi:hypothetical protein
MVRDLCMSRWWMNGRVGRRKVWLGQHPGKMEKVTGRDVQNTSPLDMSRRIVRRSFFEALLSVALFSFFSFFFFFFSSLFRLTVFRRPAIAMKAGEQEMKDAMW